jgi:signal transduction histidine kinase
MCTALKEDAVGRSPDFARRLEMMGRILRSATAQTRALARGLVPVGSDPDALQSGLTELAERINGLGRARCRFDCPTPVSVQDSKVASHLYRIAQEAVNNAVKHAQAAEITIALRAGPGSTILEVVDDGDGFSVRQKLGNGVGLGVMRHRAALIGAEFSVESKSGGGVKVRCRVRHSS